MDEPGAYNGDDLRRTGRRWLDRIASAEKRERSWCDDAKKAQAAYLCDHGDREDDGPANAVPDFNILHSNVETIVPAVYNSVGKPDIRPRHNVRDKATKQAADLFERAIAAAIDDGALQSQMEQVARDAVLAGRGVLWVRFDADEGEFGVENERLVYEAVSWKDYREGPATRFEDVPWVARRHMVSGEEMKRIQQDALMDLQADPNAEPGALEGAEEDEAIWEIWCRTERKVYFVVDASGKVLAIHDDPLGLKKFFPCVEPVQPITATGERVPVCPYSVYKVLAEELNRLTRRINAILSGLKVRGLVAGGIAEELDRLSELGDNELQVAQNMESLVANGGLANGVLWWPIETAIAVLAQLYQQREATKVTIYEVTGISDVVRGASNPVETATAQQIKSKFGALRIKRLQGMLESTEREVYKLSAEIMAVHFAPQTLAGMAGVELTEELAPFLGQPFDHLRIDVETNSTVRVDTTERKQEMAEFLAAMSQYLQVSAPIASEQPQAAAPLLEMFASFASQFQLGKQAEDAIDAMLEGARAEAEQRAQNPEPSPQEKAMQAEMQQKQAEIDAKMQEAQGKLELDRQRLQLEFAKLELEREKLAIERERLGMEGEKAGFDAVAKVAEIEMEEDQRRAVSFEG